MRQALSLKIQVRYQRAPSHVITYRCGFLRIAVSNAELDKVDDFIRQGASHICQLEIYPGILQIYPWFSGSPQRWNWQEDTSLRSLSLSRKWENGKMGFNVAHLCFIFFLIGMYTIFPALQFPTWRRIKHMAVFVSKSITFGRCIYSVRFRDKLNGFGRVSLDRGAVGVIVVGS